MLFRSEMFACPKCLLARNVCLPEMFACPKCLPEMFARNEKGLFPQREQLSQGGANRHSGPNARLSEILLKLTVEMYRKDI